MSKVHLLSLPFDNDIWIRIRDGNAIAFAIFKRHYTFRERQVRKNANRFGGQGHTVILLSKCGRALFVWRHEKYRSDGQTGINCAVFRNESGKDLLSSELILAAERIAWKQWPGQRLFTFVNSRKIKSTNPGYCFQKAGWKKCGVTKKRKLLIMEKFPE